MNKNVLITGGTGGIGSSIALLLAKDGYNIIINYFSNDKKANELKEKITNDYKVNCLVIKADVSKEDEVNKMIEQIEKELGNVDILINNAGIDLPNLYHYKTADEFRKILDVNVVGAYICAKAVGKKMLDNKYGKIINISSTNGINTYYPMCFDYDASKAALNSLTHNLALQYAPYVNVNAIAAGFISTEKELEGYDEDFLKEEINKILVKRYGEPIELAKLVKYLISDDASFINNTIIRFDGGQKGSY